MASVAYPSVDADSIHGVLALFHGSVRADVVAECAALTVEPLSEHPNRPSRAFGAAMTRLRKRAMGGLG